MISKEQFVNIMDRLKGIKDLQDNIDKLIHESYESHMNDFMDSYGFMFCCEDIIVDLLSDMFQDAYEDISYFMYELDYGRDYEDGCITDNDGNVLDYCSSADKLYDYLIEQMKNE